MTDTFNLTFTYQVAKIGNGLQTTVPNFKARGYILSGVTFGVADNKNPEIEVTLSHGGTHQKYGASYFQIFDKIDLEDYWYRLADGERVDLNIKNKSTRQLELVVIYRYKECRGTLIHSTTMRAGDLKDNNLLEDLSNGALMTDLYLKSNSVMRSLTLRPKFVTSVSETNMWLKEYDSECKIQIDANETVVDFTAEEFAPLRSMLGYYTLEIDFVSPDEQLFILAYGFKI
jgi:hypothetical protein